MATWNGMTVSVEAHRLALSIQKDIGGLSHMPVGFNIAPVKGKLRKLYTATGGKRGQTADCYEPNAAQFRGLYNGTYTRGGAEILAANRGAAPVKAPVEATPVEVEAPVYTSAPVEEAVVVETGPSADAVEALKALLGGQKVDPEAVKRIAVSAVDGRVGEVLAKMGNLVDDAVAKAVRKVEIKVASLPPVAVDKAHCALEDVLRFCAQRKHVMLKGPAGCGKTHIAGQIAQILGIPFGFAGKTIDETKLLGYMDGGGTYRSTTFRKIWEFGGVFLADEMDAWAAEALIALNAPLSGDLCDFPDGMVTKHPDTIIIAAVNTDGTGADSQYSAREVLDFASRNRFAFYEMDYDEELEVAISCDADWTRHVQKVRKAIRTVGGVDHDVTPRDSISGGEMLAAGLSRDKVEEAYIWRGMAQDTKNRILAAMR